MRTLYVALVLGTLVVSGCEKERAVVTVDVYPGAIVVNGNGKTYDSQSIYIAAPNPETYRIVLVPCKVTPYDEVAKLIQELKARDYRVDFGNASPRLEADCKEYQSRWQ